MLRVVLLLTSACLYNTQPTSNLTSPGLRGTGMITFYEGNDISQNQVCTLSWTESYTWDFQHFDACENDEARSGVLYLGEYGTTINLYDSPGGSKDDDWTEIKIKGDIAGEEIRIGSFERSQTIQISTGGEVVITHHHHNGLDGKISRVEVVVFK